jgi:hypothetical protein
MPVQRVPRYVLLLETIAKMARDDEDGVADIKLALKEIKSIASDINSTLANWEQRSKVVDVQLKFGGSVNLLTPGRLFVRGTLTYLYLCIA